jgi:hypothetical protein
MQFLINLLLQNSKFFPYLLKIMTLKYHTNDEKKIAVTDMKMFRPYPVSQNSVDSDETRCMVSSLNLLQNVNVSLCVSMIFHHSVMKLNPSMDITKQWQLNLNT